jgi:hypothetical protein
VLKDRVKHKTRFARLPGNLLDTVGEHQFDIPLISLVYNGLMAESSLLLCFLLCQDVVLESVFALDLTGTGDLEPLLRA